MRNAVIQPINSAATSQTTTSVAIPWGQVYRYSGQIVVGSGTALGSLQLQISDDQAPEGALKSGYAPTNWSNLGSAVAISAAGITAIALAESCYQWFRAVYTDTFAVINTITTVADVAGSLNNKYFYINSPTVAYYVWINVNGAGVDPMVAGKTGIEVDIATGANANAVGDAVAAALDALAAFVAPNPAANVITSTNAVGGPVAAYAIDSSVPTGFTFAHTDATASISVNINQIGY